MTHNTDSNETTDEQLTDELSDEERSGPKNDQRTSVKNGSTRSTTAARETRDSSDNNQSRRRFLHATGGIAAAALAGCSSRNGGSESNGSGGSQGNGGGGSQGNGSQNNGGQNNGSQNSQTESNQTTKNQQKFTPDPSKTFRAPHVGPMETFDPIASTTSGSDQVVKNVFDALTTFPKGNPVVKNLLAEDYSISNDKKTYTFKLTDAKFHNGKTVTSKDFVYSFERYAGSKHAILQDYLLDVLAIKHETDSDGNYKQGSLALKAPDKKTFEITLKKPTYTALQVLAYLGFSAIPEGIVGDIPGYKGEMPYEQFATKQPIGAGPFEFKSWKRGKSLDATRFDNYHGGKPSIAGVHWPIFSDDSTAYQYAMNKNVDQFTIPTSAFDQSKVDLSGGSGSSKKGTYGPLKNGMTVDMLRVLPLSIYYISFNTMEVPKPVRQAFAYVINQDQFANQIFKERARPAYYYTPASIFPGGIDKYDTTAKKNYPYGYAKSNIEKAKQVMEKAGYSESKPYKIQMTTYSSSTWAQLLNTLQSQVRPVHINMEITQGPLSTLLQRGRNGKLEGYTLGTLGNWPEPDPFLQSLYPPNTDTSNPGTVGFSNWSSKTGDAATKAKKAYETVLDHQTSSKKDKRVRNKSYMQMEHANWKDAVAIPLYTQYNEWFTYPWASVPPTGILNLSSHKYTDVKIAKNRTANQ